MMNIYPVSGVTLKRVTFLTSGTWIVPDKVYCIKVSGCAAGGGSSGQAQGGGGGAGGACHLTPITVVPGETITITIGQGVDHANGGNTTLTGTFGTLTLEGGKAGSTNGGDGGNSPGSGATVANTPGQDALEVGHRVAGAGGGRGHNAEYLGRGGRSGWGGGLVAVNASGLGGGGGSGYWGVSPNNSAPGDNTGAGACSLQTSTLPGGSGRVVIEYEG